MSGVGERSRPLSTDGPNLSGSVLNRGFACLACRKRKSKCDTLRPTCEQCVRAKTACVYDDRPQKKPTEVLKERITELEEEVRQLRQQHPWLPEAAAIASARPPPAPSTTASSSSSPHNRSGSTNSSPPSSSTTGASGFYRGQASSAVAGGSSGISSSFGLPDLFQLGRDTSEDPLPPGVSQQELIQQFITHRNQAYFDFSVNRFFQSLDARSSMSPISPHLPGHPYNLPNAFSSPTPSVAPPHASLLNAMYLLGAFFSAEPRLQSYEPLFLERARAGIARALENAERLEQALQAASLVAVYLYSKGRVLEGYYLACANARFAIGCGLHKLVNVIWEPGSLGQGDGADAEDDEEMTSTMPLLEPPRDPIELGERIHTWWQVWMVDQCGAISTNLPPALTDSTDPMLSIMTPFPPEMAEFESGRLSINAIRGMSLDRIRSHRRNVGSLRSLYDPSSPAEPDIGRRRMIAKSVELLSRAWKLSKYDVKDEIFRNAFNATDSAIRRFSSTLPRSLDSRGRLDAGLFFPHSFALAAMIQLHWIVATEHDHIHPSYQYCLNAATDMVQIIDLIAPEDFSGLELHIGTCWKLTADMLWREYNRVHGVSDPEAEVYHQALSKVQEATRQLGLVFPVLTELWRLTSG